MQLGEVDRDPPPSSRVRSLAADRCPGTSLDIGELSPGAVGYDKQASSASTDQGGGKRRSGNSAPGMSVLTVVKPRGFMNRLLIVAIFIGTLPL